MKKALIIDDRPETLYLLRVLLQGRGCEVFEAQNGVEALDLARQNLPDIAITDLLMPVMDGYTLLRHWKDDPALKTIPIVVYTATYTDSQDEKFALDMGADAFILKPAEPAPFLAQLDDICARATQGGRRTAAEPVLKEAPVILREYSEALVRRLEEKSRQLELANQDLLNREARISASEKHFRNLIANASDLVSVVDAQGVTRFQGPSSKRLLGYAPEELTNRPIFDWIHQDDAQRVATSIRQALDHPDNPVNVEYRFRHQDGSWRKLEAIGRSIIDPDGTHVIVVNARDVTASRQVEEQFRQAQKMEAIGRLAGGVAHDFNNLLMGISGFAELCRDEIPPEHTAREGVCEILSMVERAATLTRQLLAFARRQAVTPHVLDLNDTVGSMIKMLRRLIGEDIDLIWRPGAGLGAVKIDPSQVDQILANLCVNARDAIEGAGRVTIETANVSVGAGRCEGLAACGPGEYVRLIVEDDGCGMDPETRENIFEPFFTTKGVGKGTGLGLVTVYGIVKQNEGFIDVCSEPGTGTTFRIFLPRVEQAVADCECETEPGRQLGGTETILVVEDEKSILVTLSRCLGNLGYTVFAADSPEAALSLAAEHQDRIDLLLTDVVMPGMSGRELAEKLAADFRPIKVIYMSGYTADVMAHHGILQEDVLFLTKPFSRETLARKVRVTLDRAC